MSNNAPKPVVRVTVGWLVFLAVLILTSGIWLLVVAENAPQTLGAFVLFSLFGAIITFGVLGSTGIVKTRNTQFGGAAAFFFGAIAVLKLSIETTMTISGILYLDDLPVTNASIYLLNCDLSDAHRELRESDQGRFKFTGIRGKPKELEFRIQVPDYRDKIIHHPFTPKAIIQLRLRDSDLERVSKIRSVTFQAGDFHKTDYGYAIPPPLAANLSAGKSRPDVEGYVNRSRSQQDEGRLHILDDNEIKLTRNSRGNWVAVINTKEIINHQYKDAPHGDYRATLLLSDNQTQRWVTNLNYVYRIESESKTNPLEASPNFKTSADGQIKAVNSTANFVSARLRQGFDLKKDFLVRGVFYLVSTKQGKNGAAALDISFGNTWGDRVAVILGEDAGDSYSIKFLNEPVKKIGPQDTRNKIEDTGVYVTRDGRTANFFEIRLSNESDTGRLQCSIYAGASPIHPKKEKPVFTRRLEGDALGDGITKIRLKLWQSGSARIHQIEVAEIAKNLN